MSEEKEMEEIASEISREGYALGWNIIGKELFIYFGFPPSVKEATFPISKEGLEELKKWVDSIKLKFKSIPKKCFVVVKYDDGTKKRYELSSDEKVPYIDEEYRGGKVIERMFVYERGDELK
jgi:hypothetical protein